MINCLPTNMGFISILLYQRCFHSKCLLLTTLKIKNKTESSPQMIKTSTIVDWLNVNLTFPSTKKTISTLQQNIKLHPPKRNITCWNCIPFYRNQPVDSETLDYYMRNTWQGLLRQKLSRKHSHHCEIRLLTFHNISMLRNTKHSIVSNVSI